MKTIYFVRHGESEGNTSPVFMDDTVSLTEAGRAQAAVVAGRCAKIPIEIIIASTMPRARETAVIINEKIDKQIIYSDLFVERGRPSDLLGKVKGGLESVAIHKTMRDGYHAHDYQFSDEENFADLKSRAYAALDFLKNTNENNILVVTHGWFMHIVAACAIFGANLTGEECRKLAIVFRTKNTGITIFTYDDSKDEMPWRIITWNDHAHLG